MTRDEAIALYMIEPTCPESIDGRHSWIPIPVDVNDPTERCVCCGLCREPAGDDFEYDWQP